QVLRVETNLQIRTRILARHTLFRFAGLERRGKYLYLACRELHANRARAFIRKLRDPLDRTLDLVLLQRRDVRVVLRQHAFVIRKVPRQLARNQQTRAKLEEEVIVIATELRL